MVVFRGIWTVITPPSVSTPRESGVTSSSKISFTSPASTALNASADGDDFIGVDAFVRLFAGEEVADQRLHFGDARRTADEHNFLDVRRGHLGVLESLLHRTHGAFEQIVHQLLKAHARQLGLQVNGTGRASGDKGQVDFRLHKLRELDFGLFRSFLQALQRHAVLAEIDVVLFLEFVNEPIHDALVDIVTAEVGIAVSGFDFHDATADLEDGNIECAAAEVVHGDGLVALFLEAVSEGSRGRLVDDADYFHTSDLAGLFGGLALRIIEVSRNGDDGLGDFFAKEVFRGVLELRQDHRGNFGRAIGFAGNFDARVVVGALHDLVRNALDFVLHFVIAAAHEPLDGIHRVFGICYRLTLGDLAHEALACFRDGHDGRR